jgi:hypothetical protein
MSLSDLKIFKKVPPKGSDERKELTAAYKLLNDATWKPRYESEIDMAWRSVRDALETAW